MVVQQHIIWTRAKLIFAILVRSCDSWCFLRMHTRGRAIPSSLASIHPSLLPKPAATGARTGHRALPPAYSSQGSSGFPKWP